MVCFVMHDEFIATCGFGVSLRGCPGLRCDISLPLALKGFGLFTVSGQSSYDHCADGRQHGQLFGGLGFRT